MRSSWIFIPETCILLRYELNHNHAPDTHKLSRQAINSVCKRKALEDIDEKPSKILLTEISQSSFSENLTKRDLELIKHNISRTRVCIKKKGKPCI